MGDHIGDTRSSDNGSYHFFSCSLHLGSATTNKHIHGALGGIFILASLFTQVRLLLAVLLPIAISKAATTIVTTVTTVLSTATASAAAAGAGENLQP